MTRSLIWITLLSLLLVSSAALCQEDPLKAKVVEIEKAYIAGDLAARAHEVRGAGRRKSE